MKAEQPERLFFAKFIYLLNLPSYFCRAENKSAILIQNNRFFVHNFPCQKRARLSQENIARPKIVRVRNFQIRPCLKQLQ